MKRVLLAFGVSLLLVGTAVVVRAAEHPAVARDMAGVWLPDSRRSQRPSSPWPLQPQAQAQRERYMQVYGPIDPEIDDASASCILEPMPYPVRITAQYPFELLFTADRVTMFSEIYGSIRRIRIGASRPALEVLPSAMGQSLGRWEGNTLVVETTQIRRAGAGKPTGDPPVSSARRIVERWSLGKDEEGRRQLRNEFTVHDPMLAQPVTFQMAYKWSPDIAVGEYLCQQDIWDQNLQGSPSTVPWRH